jgi:hypothetical protein
MSYYDILDNEVLDAVKVNDINKIKEILLSGNHPKLSQDEKEQQVFSNIHISFHFFKNGEDILNYLIFEYNIKYENSLEFLGININDEIKKMFDKRKLNEEIKQSLSSELNIYDKITKKIKI